jgi:amidohydrolase
MIHLPEEIRTRIREWVSRITPQAIEIRRDIHRHPERSKREQRTSDVVAAELSRLGYGISRYNDVYGITAVLKGKQSRPTIALRADMDALKLNEQTGLPFASEVEGVMHACGHDAHTAILLGVADVLRSFSDIMAGSVKFIFQPSEEAFPGGALPMIQEGMLENPVVDAALALHLDNTLPTGQVAVRSGPTVAGVTSVNINVMGKGGHFAAPHETVDPILAAAHVIVAIQSMVTRLVDGRKPFVLTFGQFLAGTRDNIIPEEVIIRGDMAAVDDTLRENIEENLIRLVENVSSSFGAKGAVSFWRGYPTLVNDTAMMGLVQDMASEICGVKNVAGHELWMTGEDFAFVAQKVPSALWFLGSWNTQKYASPTRHHDPRFDLDEACIPLGIELFTCMALEYLYRYSEGGKP